MSCISQKEFRCTSDSLVRSFYRNRRVLIVGADGFLGSNCIEALKTLEANISIVTRRPRPRVDVYGSRVFQGDIRDPQVAQAAVQGQEIVVDFLGVAGAVDSNRDPSCNLNEELRAHLSLFQACAYSSSSPIVLFCSSRLVYGKPKYLPVDENHPLAPGSIYAVHKITAEEYLRVFAETQGLRWCALRLSTPYGPGQEDRPRSYGIINQFLRAAAEGREIRLYGDGQQKRDYVHVEDVLAAFLPCAMDENCHRQVFNFGGRAVISLRGVAELIAELAGGVPVTFEPWPEDYKAVETGDYVTNLAKIDSFLTLPRQRSLREGFLEVLAWYRSQRDGAALASANQTVKAV